MSLVVPRQYQQDMKREIYESWNAGNRNVFARLDTGGGKSVITSDIILDGFNMGYGQVVIAHRNELVGQMSEHIANRGIPHTIIGSDKTIKSIRSNHYSKYNRSFIQPKAITAVASVDTLVRRAGDLKPYLQQVSRWVTDEAHHVLEHNKWGKACNLMPNALGLGVSATPLRADGNGLSRETDGIFDHMVCGPDMRFLIDNSYLCDYEILCPKSDMVVRDEDKSKNGDWSNQTLKKSAEKSHIVGDTVENYIKYANGRRAIVFATDIETSDKMAHKFRMFGIKAASLSSRTETSAREKAIEDFRSGRISVLVNVDLFDEGFDVPACDVVILARPTASLGKYRQMVGRCLRYAKGKTALIIDQVSNVIRHGLPDKQIEWSLGRGDKRSSTVKDPDEIPMRECHECTRPYQSFMVACPHCGAEKPLPSPQNRTIDVVEGDLVLLDKETLRQMREKTVMESPGSIGERVGRAAGSAAAHSAAKRQIEKIGEHNKLKDAINHWAGIERAKGFDDREIHRKFYLTLGVDVVTAMDATKTRVDLEKTREKVQSWYM